MNSTLESILTFTFLATVLRVTTPILLPALGGLIAELTGKLNIALEGTMLLAAFTGVVISAKTQSIWLGVLAALAASGALALFMAWLHMRFKADLIILGFALNILASSGTIFLLYTLTGDRGSSVQLKSLTLPNISLGPLKNVWGLGDLLHLQNLMVFVAFAMVGIVWIFLYRTIPGAHLRAVGSNPEAAATAGINVRRIQYLGLLFSGLLAGMGGIHMAMGYLQLFQPDMTAGRGFIALAAVAMGGRRPGGTLLAALTFGATDALAIQLGVLDWIPSQLIQMLPYLATVIALIIYGLLHKRALARHGHKPAQPKG